MPDFEFHFKEQSFFFSPEKDSFAFSYPSTQSAMQNIDYEKLVASLILPLYRFENRYQIFIHFPRSLDSTKMPTFLERQSTFQMRSDLGDFLVGLHYSNLRLDSNNHSETLMLVHDPGVFSNIRHSAVLNRLPAQSDAAKMSVDPDKLTALLASNLDSPRWMVPSHFSPSLVVGNTGPSSQFWVVSDNLSSKNFKLNEATVERIIHDESKGILSNKRISSGGLCFFRIQNNENVRKYKYLFRQSYPLKSYYSIEAHCHQLARAWKKYGKIRIRFCSEQLLLPYWIIKMLERTCEQHEVDVIVDTVDFSLAKPELVSLSQYLLDSSDETRLDIPRPETQIWVALDNQPSLLTCERHGGNS